MQTRTKHDIHDGAPMMQVADDTGVYADAADPRLLAALATANEHLAAIREALENGTMQVTVIEVGPL